MLIPWVTKAQVGLINNGVNLTVNNGVDLRVNGGSITNQNSGSIKNDGNIYLDLSLTQNTSATYLGGAASWLWFEGATNQNITADAVVSIARLKVDNGNKLTLGNQVNVSTGVDLTLNGKIELGANNLVLASGATIANYDVNNYIITNGTGILQQEVSAAVVVFPVGNSTYNPLNLTNSGTVDNFLLKVEDQVWGNGTTGNLETSNIVNRTWHLNEEVAGGSNASITVQWEQGQELTTFDRTNCALSHWNGSAWDHSMAYTSATNIGGTNWTQTRSGQTTFSPFALEDLMIELPVELLFFNAERKNVEEVLLSWSTATEINNQGFEIERMYESQATFESIGWVDGQGTTTSTTNYQYTDENSYGGISYYRLKQIDHDGTFSYSAIKAVAGDGDRSISYTEISIYPNPVADELKVRFDELPKSIKSAQIKIISSNGQILHDFETGLESYQVLKIGYVKRLVPALYILSVELDNGDKILEEFIKK
jgi:hypothetical protein